MKTKEGAEVVRPSKEEKTIEATRLKMLDSIVKKYGRDVLSNDVESLKSSIPSSSISLNLLLGVGGLPGGRIVEIYGQPGSGKTLISLDFIANAQKAGKRCAFIDAEYSLDKNWAKKLGVDLDMMDCIQPQYGEQAFDIMEEMIRSGIYGVIVLDSVASLVPKVEAEGTLEETQNRMGLMAKMMSQGLRKLTGLAFRSDTGLLFVNQIRETMKMYGSPEDTPGGKALKFYASVRLKVAKVWGKDATYSNPATKKLIGHRIAVDVIKNKCADRSGNLADFDLFYLTGIDVLGDILDNAARKEVGLVKKSITGYTYKDKIYSKEAMKGLLSDDPVLKSSFVNTIIDRLKNATLEVEGLVTEAEAEDIGTLNEELQKV